MGDLVSIIIPTYNRAHLIGETLESIIAQSYPYWECIVVDDRSTDHTEEVMEFYVARDSRIKYYKRPDKLISGANSCRNYGFEMSKGKFINWFDSDDLMHPQKLEKQIEVLNTEVLDMCVCQTLVFEDNKLLGLRHPNLESEDPFNDFIVNNIKWLTQAPMIRKKFLLEINHFFDPELTQSQEWDYFVRLLNEKLKYKTIEEPLVYFRKHKQSISYGEMDSIKILSFFKSRYKILVHYSNGLKENSKKQLKNELIGSYVRLLHKREFGASKNVKDQIAELSNFYNWVFRYIQLNLAYYSFWLIGKGELILRRNR